ncbi:porin [Rhodoferax sp.]|jgi:predicted porin|uniref:porin n=1 Tax=Rhodoferax sp. TaxID=50421 RepID=UPI003783D036
MKKTLVALAVLAATGTAFAQSTVTISGKFGYQYSDTKSQAGAKANGFNTSDGDVNFAMTEDLGAGMSAQVFMGIRLRGRDINSDGASDGIGARDSRITLAGPFGSITAGAVASGSGIVARGSAGAAGFQGLDHDSTLVDAELNGVDLFQYTSPSFSGANVYLQIVDSIGDPGAGGLESASLFSSATVVGVNYAAGPISANVDFTTYDRNANVANPTFTAKERVRLSGSYNLGVANLGFGYQTNDNTTTDVKQWIAGVSVPMGAFSLGLNYAERDTKTLATGASAKNKGYEMGVNYALSKRTAVAASYRSVDVAGAAEQQTSTRVRLMHSF